MFYIVIGWCINTALFNFIKMIDRGKIQVIDPLLRKEFGIIAGVNSVNGNFLKLIGWFVLLFKKWYYRQ